MLGIGSVRVRSLPVGVNLNWKRCRLAGTSEFPARMSTNAASCSCVKSLILHQPIKGTRRKFGTIQHSGESFLWRILGPTDAFTLCHHYATMIGCFLTVDQDLDEDCGFDGANVRTVEGSKHAPRHESSGRAVMHCHHDDDDDHHMTTTMTGGRGFGKWAGRRLGERSGN